MEYHVLASGSKGNATFVYVNHTGILIDCGISRKQLYYRLETVGFNPDDIQYVLLTHDHYDHKKNIHLFDPKICYSGFGCIDEIPVENVLKAYKEIVLNDVHILPLAISHDATSPLAFVITYEDDSFVYMTDTGYVSKKNMKYIDNKEYYVIESNHDIDMLMNTNRPLYLKKRILSDKGHLDNHYSAQMMSRVLGANTREIVLAHLSEEANTPELAYQTYIEVLRSNRIELKNIKIMVASQVNVVSGGIHED